MLTPFYSLTLPDDWTPLHKHKNTIAHAANKLSANDNLTPPVSSMPDEIPRTWLLQNIHSYS